MKVLIIDPDGAALERVMELLRVGEVDCEAVVIGSLDDIRAQLQLLEVEALHQVLVSDDLCRPHEVKFQLRHIDAALVAKLAEQQELLPKARIQEDELQAWIGEMNKLTVRSKKKLARQQTQRFLGYQSTRRRYKGG